MKVFINFAKEQNEPPNSDFSQPRRVRSNQPSKDPKNQVIRILQMSLLCLPTTGLNTQLDPNEKFFPETTIPSSPDGIHSSHSRMKTINETHTREVILVKGQIRMRDFIMSAHHKHHYAKTNWSCSLSYLPHSRIRTDAILIYLVISYF